MTSSGTSGGSPQKQLKKRLTSLARKTHNRVCCDCPEKAPTWAVILSPPSDYAPMGSRDLVAFVCFNCAGVHRQLGTSQVKSIALDEWTEYDVESAELSGNKYVNKIYEGTLKEKMDATAAIMLKPIAGAHEASRQRFIKEKYAQRTYYSRPAHFQHVAQRKVEPSTPSKSRRSSLMVFLKNKESPSGDPMAAFVKGSGGGGREEEGTLSTSPSSHQDVKSLHPFPIAMPIETGRSVQRRHSMGPLMTPSSPFKNSKGPLVSTFPKRTSIAVTSPSMVWDLTSSPKQSPSSRENSERVDRKVGKRETSAGINRKTESTSERLDRKNVVANTRENSVEKPTSLKPSRKIEDYRDPRRANFHQSKGSVDFNILDDENDDGDDDNTKATAPVTMVEIGVVPDVPRTPRPVLMATKSLPSPANSRMSLYSRNITRPTRGRSSSRPREVTEGIRDRTSTRIDKKDRGRSKSTNHRDRSPEKARKTSGERTSSSDLHAKRSSSTPASPLGRRTTSPRRSRTSRASSSPLRIRRSVSHSRPPTENLDESRQHGSSSQFQTSNIQESRRRSRSSSTRPRTQDVTESRRRSSSTRPRTEGTEKSSSRRSPSSSRYTKPAIDESNDRPSRTRSRSGSRLRTREKSTENDSKSLLLRESGSRRAARERSRSRSRPTDVLGDLKKATTRRESRSSDMSVMSEPWEAKKLAMIGQANRSSNSCLLSESDTKRQISRRDGCGSKANSLTELLGSTTNAVKRDRPDPPETKKIRIHRVSRRSNGSITEESSQGRKETKRRDSQSSDTSLLSSERSNPKHVDNELDEAVVEGELPLNDEDAFELTVNHDTTINDDSMIGDDPFDGNNSLSLESAFLEETTDAFVTPHGHRKGKKNILKEGEESFQVISAAGRSYNFGAVSNNKKSNPRDKAFGRSYNGPIFGDIEEFEKSVRLPVVRGGDDKFEKSKLRLSRGKAAEKHAERSSRKHDIFAALDQTEDDMAAAGSTTLRRVAPLRSKSAGGVPRPLMRNGMPLKSRSDAGTNNKKLSKHTSELLEREAEWPTTRKSDSVRRAEFHQSFDIAELIG